MQQISYTILHYGIFMSRSPQQAVRDSASFLGAVFDSIIEEVTVDIESFETEDI